jgi:hypothetical protein
MWISGRRSFRPDSGFYRDQRRLRLRRPPARGRGRARLGPRRGSMLIAVLAVVLALLAAGAWLLVR